jgi:serine/threonine protein phosphatase PrpC
MEDEHIALPAFVPRGAGSGAGVSLFGVFDGHGGRHCATFLKSARRSARAKRRTRDAPLPLRPRGTEDGGGGRASRRALHRDLRGRAPAR